MRQRHSIAIVGGFFALLLLAIIGAGVAIWRDSQNATTDNTEGQAVPGYA